MSKGLRLSFYGVACSVEEIKAMAHTLVFKDCPVFHGWTGMDRNWMDLDSHSKGKLYDVCESLVGKGLMEVHPGKAWRCSDSIFKVTVRGITWFKAFIHKHPHADLYRSAQLI